MISQEFIRLLRCPLNHGPLRVAEPGLVKQLNAKAAEGRLVNHAGEKVDRQIDEGLVDQPPTILYPIHDEIPCLLVDEAIPLNQLGDGGKGTSGKV